MSWLFSQALVEEYLGDTSLDGEQSAPLSGNNTQQAYCAPDKMTKFSRLSRFGMTYKLLTETLGEELLTLYLADFHAKTLVQQGGGAGITGERSSLWKHMARIIGEVRPRYAFVENSPMLTTRGLGVVLADLSTLGFDAKWGVVSAADIGANHQRERIWIRAEQRNFFSHAEHDGIGWWQQQSKSVKKTNVVDFKSDRNRRITGKLQTQDEQQATKRQKKRVWQSDNASQSNGAMANPSGARLQRHGYARINDESISKPRFSWGGFDCGGSTWWEVEPDISRVANGVAARVDRLKAIGNGQVPLCAATAWKLLK